MSTETKYNGLEVAIIGMSAAFPDSPDYRAFWNNLLAGKELVKEYSHDEILQSGVPEEALASKAYVRFGSKLDQKDVFDHGFFEYTREEAALMDPQTRLMHQHCWKALEDAGYASQIPKKKIGLFLSATENNNWKIYAYGNAQNAPVDIFLLDKIANASYISTLISYKLNLRGPSLSVSTACSSSLTAVNLAFKSLLNRECVIAMAGGVSLSSTIQKGYLREEGTIFSADGHCRAFDKDASGTIAGEGIGVVVMKRLKDALEDGDHIYAVIKSCVANNDGKLKVGFTAPSVQGQADCIRMAHKFAGVEPSTIRYVEAHGTGTRLGDPIEIRALNQAFGVGITKKCPIGSVKTNMGHLDVAAGIAGLIKACLTLKHKVIPPSLHYRVPNPEIDFASGPFYVNNTTVELKRDGNTPLRAGVSSFGIGGTNVHVVLEEAPEFTTHRSDNVEVITTSAKTESALIRYIADLKHFLVENPASDLSDIAFTLQTGRQHFSYRKTFVCTDSNDLMEGLKRFENSKQDVVNCGKSATAVFMFSGQGSQYHHMFGDIYNSDAFFKAHVDKGFSQFTLITGKDLKQVVFPMHSDDTRLNETDYAQAAIYIFEYALAKMLMRLGVNPEFMIGHSIGEYVAACLAEVFTFEDGLKLVIRRGELMKSIISGAMVSASMKEADAGRFLLNGISLAAVNAPEQIVFSGPLEKIAMLKDELDKQGIPYVHLKTSHAFHSQMQDGILEEFKKVLTNVPLKEPKLKFISILSGEFISNAQCVSPAYWVRHLRETVRFGDGIRTITNQRGDKIFLELGAGNALTKLTLQQKNQTTPRCFNLVRHTQEKVNDIKHFFEKLGDAWAAGLLMEWQLLHQNEQRRKIPLPTYAFEPTVYLAEVNPFAAGSALASTFANPKYTTESKSWLYYPVWQNKVSRTPAGSIKDRLYLFFADESPFSESLRNGLEASSASVIEVVSGRDYLKVGKNRYEVNPASDDNFARLFDDLKAEGCTISDVLYHWVGQANISGRQQQLHDNPEILARAYFGFTLVVRHLIRVDAIKDIRFFVLTDGLHRVSQKEHGVPIQSLILGIVNTLPQEYPVTCVNIDIDSIDDTGIIAQSVIRQMAGQTKERIIALRNGMSWHQDFQVQSMKPFEKSVIRKDGLYIITGGLGNVGFTLAKHLLHVHQAKLILLGRRDQNEQSIGLGWDRLKSLQSISPNVWYYPVDITDGGAFEALIGKLTDERGVIRGVIHAAGEISREYFESIGEISEEKTKKLFSPKVNGIENIYKIFRNRPHDFVWITSSLASVLGGLAYSSYAAANIYLDNFVLSKGRELAHWKCVGLAEMAFSEKDVKSQAGPGLRSSLLPEDVVDVFEWTLGQDERSVILETVLDIHERLERVYHTKRDFHLNDALSDKVVQKRERPHTLSHPYEAPVTNIEIELSKLIEEFFGLEKVGIEDNFFELGGDSLKAMVLLKRIKGKFEVTIHLKDFFDHQTVKLIAAAIEEKVWIASGSEKKFVSII